MFEKILGRFHPPLLPEEEKETKMEFGLKIAIEHEEDVINSAKEVLKKVKGFTSENPEVTKSIDFCSDELNKIIASSELFIKFLDKPEYE